MNKIILSGASSLAIFVMGATAYGQSFPDLSKFKLPSKEEVTKTQKFLAGGTGCLAGGALGYFGGKEVAKLLGEDRELTKDQEEKFILGAALAGCAVGAAVGVNIIENMSESAKQAQLDAWQEAQQQTGPVSWHDPNDESTRGQTELVEVEALPSGEKCGFRRDTIETVDGTVEPQQRVCQTGGGSWEPRFS